MGDLGGEEVELFQALLRKLQDDGKLESGGVDYNPYEDLQIAGTILALVKDGEIVSSADQHDSVGVVLPGIGDTGGNHGHGDPGRLEQFAGSGEIARRAFGQNMSLRPAGQVDGGDTQIGE